MSLQQNTLHSRAQRFPNVSPDTNQCCSGSIFDRLIRFKSGLEVGEIGERVLRLTPRRHSIKAACSRLPLLMKVAGWGADVFACNRSRKSDLAVRFLAGLLKKNRVRRLTYSARDGESEVPMEESCEQNPAGNYRNSLRTCIH
jgi:hypothetical protein